MAAAPQQPEMAGLPGVPPLLASATSIQDGVGASEGSSRDRAHSLTGHPESAFTATINDPVQPAMYAVSQPDTHHGGTLRGADNEVAVTANADNATIVSRRSEEAGKGPAKLHTAPIITSEDPGSVKKGELPTSKTSSVGPPESQEKGEQVTIELLLLSGLRKRFYFQSSATVSEVLAWTFKDWPAEWEEHKPRDLSQLRLLYRGQFLQGSSKLSTHTSEDSSVTVMHLNIRPQETSEAVKPKRTKTPNSKAATTDTHGGGCCSSCTIS